MPIPTTFLDTCRTRVLALPEYAAFVAAGVIAAGVIAEPALRPARDAQWGALYAGGDSLAHRLRRAIRAMVNAEADKYSAGTAQAITAGERETCYATLAGEYAPAVARPTPAADELSAFLRFAQEDQL